MASLYPQQPSGIRPEVQALIDGSDYTAQYSAPERLLQGIATSGPRAVENVSAAGATIGRLLGLTEGDGRYLPPELKLPPGQTGPQKFADIASMLMPVGIEIGMTAGAVGGMMRGAPPLARAITSEAAGFGLLGLSEDATTGAEQTAEGAAYGAMRMLPRLGRILPAAAVALGSKAFFDMKDDRPMVAGMSRGDISAGAGFITAFLPGQIPRKAAAAALAPPLLLGNGDGPIARPEGTQFTRPYVEPTSPDIAGTIDPDTGVIRGMPSSTARPGMAESIPDLDATFTRSESFADPDQLLLGINRADNPFVQLRDMGVERLDEQQLLNSIPRSADAIPMGQGSIPPRPFVPDSALVTSPFDAEYIPALQSLQNEQAAIMQQVADDPFKMQLAMLTGEAKLARRDTAVDFLKWQMGLGETPTSIPKALTRTVPDDTFEQMVARGASPDSQLPLSQRNVTEPPLTSSPLPEGTTTGMTKGKVGMQPSWKGTEGGSVQLDFSGALGRTAAGALIGGAGGALTDDPGSNTGLVTGMVAGGLLAAFGPAILKHAVLNQANRTKPNKVPINSSPTSTTVGTPKFSLSNLMSEAQLNVWKGSDSIADRSLARIDTWFGTSMGPRFSRILGQSIGEASYHVRNLDDAFRQIGTIQVDDTMKAAVTAFFDRTKSASTLIQDLGVTSAGKAYADFAIVARNAIDGLIDIGSRGQGNAKRTQMMQDSMGKYLTKSYGMFVDPKYRPAPAATEALAQKLFASKAWGDNTSLTQIQDGLHQWVHEVKQMKGVYTGSASASGMHIDQSVFKHSKKLDTEWKTFLGEVTDPVDRIRLTTMKLKPIAEASQFMETITSGAARSDEGLKFSFNTHGEVEAAAASVEQALKNAPNDLTLRKQLLELQQYKYVQPTPRNGALQGKYVHRNVFDVVEEWDNVKNVDSAFTRTMNGINQMMKSNVTYRNPMSIMRQALSAPFFLQASRGWSHLGPAHEALRNPAHPMNIEMIRNGVIGVDSITKDVLRDVDRLSGGMAGVTSQQGSAAFLGRIDAQIGMAGSRMKQADSKLADWFKYPDTLVRASTYLSAKARFADEMGLALNDMSVINRAVEFTNRYTMNYALLPKAVVAGRTVPFVNMFISYTAEMGRILKNLGEDVIKGDGAARMNAVMALGFMVALPAAIQSGSEASLSAKDREDWEKVKAGMPNFSKYRGYFVAGRDPKTKKFRVFDYSNLLPADQFTQVVRAIADGNAKGVAEVNPIAGFDNNPFLNITASLVTGKDRFSGRNLRGPSDHFATVAKEVLGPLTPGQGSQWRAAELAFSTNKDGGMGIIDKRGKSMTPSDFWLPWATAIKSSNMDLDVIQKSAIADYKGRVANEMAYFNDIRKSTQPREVVDKAAERTREALRQLQENLSVRLGIPLDQLQ